MTREVLINRTISNLQKLPEEKLKEVSDYTDKLVSKTEDKLIVEGIQKLASVSGSFDFLKDEEELYSVNDLKERYR